MAHQLTKIIFILFCTYFSTIVWIVGLRLSQSNHRIASKPALSGSDNISKRYITQSNGELQPSSAILTAATTLSTSHTSANGRNNTVGITPRKASYNTGGLVEPHGMALKGETLSSAKLKDMDVAQPPGGLFQTLPESKPSPSRAQNSLSQILNKDEAARSRKKIMPPPVPLSRDEVDPLTFVSPGIRRSVALDKIKEIELTPQKDPWIKNWAFLNILLSATELVRQTFSDQQFHAKWDVRLHYYSRTHPNGIELDYSQLHRITNYIKLGADKRIIIFVHGFMSTQELIDKYAEIFLEVADQHIIGVDWTKGSSSTISYRTARMCALHVIQFQFKLPIYKPWW